jgi:hypothetical protein
MSPWVFKLTFKLGPSPIPVLHRGQEAEHLRLERVEAQRRERLRRRQAMKERLKRGGVVVESEEEDHEDVFDGDDGRTRLDYEAVGLGVCVCSLRIVASPSWRDMGGGGGGAAAC